MDELVVCVPGDTPAHDGASRLTEREAHKVLDASVYYDRASALRCLGGDESLLWGLMDLFVEDCPRQLDRIKEVQNRGDHTALHSYAHALKGTVGHFSAARALEAARQLEEIALGQDRVAIEECVAKLEHELDSLKEVFRQAANDRAITRA